MILQRAQHVTRYVTIRRIIYHHLDSWGSGEFGMMAEDTTRTYAQYLSNNRGEYTAEHRAKIFHSLVLWVNIRSSVQWISDREKFRVFQPGDIFPNIGKPVLEVLCSKFPGACPPTAGSFKAYRGQPPAFIPVDVTN